MEVYVNRGRAFIPTQNVFRAERGSEPSVVSHQSNRHRTSRLAEGWSL